MDDPAEEFHCSKADANAPAFVATIPDHQLIRVIGKGSYGEVWLARSSSGIYRAIKIVRENSFRHSSPFEREFRGVKKIESISRSHESLMDVLQVERDESAGYFYCVMELADDLRSGQNIIPETYSPRTLASDMAQRKSLPVAECLKIGIKIASALDFLHTSGLIHRDVKPSNIVFVNGVPKLADIGLVIEATEAKSYVGTEGFIPPEGPGTRQSDVYSLGKVLYEISTGKDRHDFPELPTFLEKPDQDTTFLELNRIILKACRADPRKRYASAAKMCNDLIRLGRSEPLDLNESSLHRKAIIIALAVALFIGLVFATKYSRHLFAQSSNGQKNTEVIAETVRRPFPTPDGLLAWWKAEGDASDSVAGFHVVALNQAKFSAGKVGEAFAFHGSGEGLIFSNSPVLNPTNGLTLEAWVLVSKFPANDGVVIAGKDWPHEQRQYLLALNSVEGHWSFRPHVGVPSGLAFFDGATSVKTGIWYHVAMSYDGSKLRLYVNGTEDGSLEVRDHIIKTTSPFVIGGFGEGPWSLDGRIDELSLYDRALSLFEIKAVYGAGSKGKGPALPLFDVDAKSGLVAWWRGEKNGLDTTGGNNGILQRGTQFAAGKIGQAFDFDGVNSCVCVPDSSGLRFTNELTIEFWARRVATNRMTEVIVNKGGDWTGRNLNYGVVLSGQAKPAGVIFLFAGGNRTSAGFDDLEWHHYAISARNGDRDPVVYVDGVVQPVMEREGASTITLYPSHQPLYIGAEIDPANGWNYYGKVLVDELRLYRRARSASEVEASYASAVMQAHR